MCILFVALNQHPNYPLIIAANRDEFHERPTQEMHWWQQTEILAGKDLQGLGTWLGLTKNGHFSALTNYRKLPLKEGEFKSRGELVLKALTDPMESLVNHLDKQAAQYQGFNLLYGDQHGLVCFDSTKHQFTTLTSGFFSLCNGSLDDKWPKMAKGEQALEHYVTSNNDISHEELLMLLKDKEQASDDLLPSTGIGLEWERKLSAIFIQGDGYGTRSSCVITIDSKGKFKVTEITYSTNGLVEQSNTFQWQT